jgi:thioredoxin 1
VNQVSVCENAEKDRQMTENKSTKPVVLNEVNFDAILAESEVPLLFEFWAAWCHHCSALSPIIDEVAEEMAGKIIVGQINCDLNRDLCRRYEVKGIPTLFLARQGEIVGTIVNPKDKEALVSWVKGILA